jgi:hypothetical protein
MNIANCHVTNIEQRAARACPRLWRSTGYPQIAGSSSWRPQVDVLIGLAGASFHRSVMFIEAERAALAIVVGEIRTKGRCDLPIDLIAARAEGIATITAEQHFDGCCIPAEERTWV